ncbi:uncharacterized protein PODANS_5_560, partial [Podospora anserina S mat+]
TSHNPAKTAADLQIFIIPARAKTVIQQHQSSNIMNRSRYVPQQSAYTAAQFQPFGPGPVPTPAQMPGMIPMGYPQQQMFGGSPNPNAMGASPILQQQQAMSPNALWAANFANGPIIEDLCAPPQMGLPTSPPMNALPPRGMPMGAAIHPSSMPQVQNVFGLRQPGTPHPGHGFAPMMPGVPSSHGWIVPSRLCCPATRNCQECEPGFATGGNGTEQMGSPSMGNSPGAQPLTPVESTLQGFMSPDSI